MQRYEKGNLGKLIVQDWNILAHYSEVPRLYILSDRQCAALISLATFLEWSTRYKNLPVDADIDAFASETKFNLMNPITCGMLQECLQPLFDTLRAQVLQDANFRDFGTDDPTGVPLSEASRSRDQAAGSNPTCDLDILWAQCTQTIEYTVTIITDVLEKAEEATNQTELAGVIAALPVLDELGADAIAGYAAFIQECIAENYAADITTAYKDEAACELFCLCKGDCQITLERLQQVFQSRVESYFASPMGILNTITDLFAYFVGNPPDGTIIADAMHLVLWAGGVLTNQFLGDVGTKTLQTVLLLAVNDANDDWLILCPDCPNEWTVPATSDPALDQFDTAFVVVNGVDYRILATGVWNGGAGADCTADGNGTVGGGSFLVPTGFDFSLCYRIGLSGTWKFAGADIVITADDTDTLYFALNDTPGAYGDNTGALTVIVSVEP